MAEAIMSATDAPPPAPHSIDLERRAIALARWRKRSQQVHFFRKALPAAIAAILVFGVGWIAVRALIAVFSPTDRDVSSIHLLNPTFYGRNEKGEPYVMQASEAVRDGADPDRVYLTNPSMKQFNANPQPMTVRALHGLYLEQKKLLDLSGKVVAKDGRGYTFLSEFAHVDMPHNSVVGNVHCFGFGPSGSISSDAYQVYDKGDHAIFTGHVRSKVIMASKKADATPGAAPAASAASALVPPPMPPSVVTPAPH